MYLRKLSAFNTILGFTLPKDVSNVMSLEKGNYIELYVKDPETLVVKKHEIKRRRITIAD